MYIFRKGVVSFVSAIILTAVLIASSISIYLWGVPYIEKNRAASESSYLQTKFVEMAGAIEESVFKGKKCIDLATDAKIFVTEDYVVGVYFSPTSIFNNFLRMPLNSIYYPEEIFNLSTGDEVWDGKIKISFDGTQVCFYDNNTKLERCVTGGVMYTTVNYYKVEINQTESTANVMRVNKIYYAEPTCIAYVSAMTTGNGQQITFEIECQPFIRSDKLYKIKILPAVDYMYERGERFCAQFYKVEQVQVNATLEDSYMTIYYVYAGFE